MIKIYCFIVCLFVAYTGTAQQKLTPVDSASKVHFTIKNFAINTNGELSGLKGQIVLDKAKPANSMVDVTVNVASINTDNSKRDNHLRSADFFDAEHYPVIRITGKPQPVNDNTYILKANLTIKNITKAIEIPFTITPKGRGMLFEGTFRINRLDYTIGKESATMADGLNIDLKVYAE